MGSAGENADSVLFPDDINAILRDYLGYEPTEKYFDCMLSSSEDEEEMGDNFSMFDQLIAMANSETNLCHDLQSVNLTVPGNQWMEDNLINGYAQHYFSPHSTLPFDGLALEATNPQINVCPTLSVDENASFYPTLEDSGNQCAFELEATDVGKPDSSELKKKGVDLFCEAGPKGMEQIDDMDATEEEALDIDDAEGKSSRKASTCTTEFEPRMKSCYKNKGISVRLSRLKSGN